MIFSVQGASPTSPISIEGRRVSSEDDPESSPPGSLSSSFGSSYGSPGSDLAEIRDLKKNFSNQVAMETSQLTRKNMTPSYLWSGTTAWSAPGRTSTQFQEDGHQGEGRTGLRQQARGHEVQQEGELQLCQALHAGHQHSQQLRSAWW